jgi:hypothetical protein
MDSVSLDKLTLATFLPVVNTLFRVRVSDSAFVELQLTRATPARHSRPDGGDHKSFSLFFSGPGDRSLEQRTYLFEHDQIGRFDLFMVPVGRSGKGLEYQAVFNRLEPEA